MNWKVATACGALAMFAAACQDSGQSNGSHPCVNGMNEAFARVAAAQRQDIARCVELGRRGEVATTIEACVADDEEGTVANAKQETLSIESSECQSAPDFGYSSGATVNAEASAAEVELIHDLFGPDLDAVIAMGVAGDCQQALIALVGSCTDSFINDYNTCAKATPGAGATDETALVQCKGSDANGDVARVCQTELADGIATECSGQDLDALVPGCADVSHAVCLAAKSVGAPSQALNASASICEPIDPGLPEAPAPEPVVLETISLPAEILGIW